MSEGTRNYFTIPGLDAGANLSAAQYKLVKLASTARQVILAAAKTDTVIGVLMNDPSAQGQPAEVACIGVVKLVAEASVSAGVNLVSNSTGQAQGSSTTDDDSFGVAITASTDAGDLITAVIGPSQII